MTISPFLAALGSKAPPADGAKDMHLYGWLIGSWEMDTIRHLDDGTTEESTGEIHFGWVLEGRAIQDIWIRPRRPAPSYSRQIGRAEGKDIVQIGEDSRGLKARWRFTEIAADSFHWIGEERSSGNDPWQITYEHFARRERILDTLGRSSRNWPFPFHLSETAFGSSGRGRMRTDRWEQIIQQAAAQRAPDDRHPRACLSDPPGKRQVWRLPRLQSHYTRLRRAIKMSQ
ncbi:hypothetical protein [Mesorhizobium sp.]|uniref:hypothetical protein n=3 Tax=Mesorhizobium sp. TaxID=1871066 RepID=UPI00257F8690|nr:hypothetical protein [Mesorhizobium sp.]